MAITTSSRPSPPDYPLSFGQREIDIKILFASEYFIEAWRTHAYLRFRKATLTNCMSKTPKMNSRNNMFVVLFLANNLKEQFFYWLLFSIIHLK